MDKKVKSLKVGFWQKDECCKATELEEGGLTSTGLPCLAHSPNAYNETGVLLYFYLFYENFLSKIGLKLS